MASKGVVQAEELRLQLGDRLPVAMRLMAEAAKDAGISTTGTVAEMGDLMKQGKLLSAQVLPHFATRMRNLARDNDALALALKYNLSPALGRAKLQLQEIQDEAFKGGIKAAVMDVLGVFGVYSEDLKEVAKDIGYLVKIVGKLFTLISMIPAVILDIKDLISSISPAVGKSVDLLINPLDRVRMLVEKIRNLLNFEWKMPTFSMPALPSVPSMGTGASAVQAYRQSTGSNKPLKVDLSVRGTDGLIEVVDQKVSSGQDAMLSKAYNSMYGG